MTDTHDLIRPSELARRTRGRATLMAGAVGAVLLVAGCSSSAETPVAQPEQNAAAAASPNAAAPNTAIPNTATPNTAEPDDNSGATGAPAGTSAPADTSAAGTSAPAGTGATGTSAPADADSFVRALDAAVAAAGGTGADSVERQRSGFEVEVQFADGTDRTVHVLDDGRTELENPDDDQDSTPDPALTADQIRSLFTAVAGWSATAQVTDISTSGDRARYEVSVQEPDGTEVDLDVDEAFTVTVDDIDHPDDD